MIIPCEEACKHFNDQMEKLVDEIRRWAVRLYFRINGMPEFVAEYQRRRRKLRRRARYYRRLAFKQQERQRRGKK